MATSSTPAKPATKTTPKPAAKPAARPTTVAQYLKALPADRRAVIAAVRAEINANIDPAYQEGIQYSMIGWFVPHSVYPKGYHCDPKQPVPFLSLANQKNHVAAYMFCLYCDPAALAAFEKNWSKSGKKLDMGKSCVRFKTLDGVCLEAIGKAVKAMPAKKFIKSYEANLTGASGGFKQKSPATKTAAKKAAKKTVKKAAAKKAVAKKA